jgi:hypothetical protein
VRRLHGTRTTPLTTLTAITPDERQELAELLRRWQREGQTPFGATRSTHFARWVILDRKPPVFPGAPFPPRALQMDYLLFTATFNGSVTAFVEELRSTIGPVTDEVWGHCVGYPGRADAVAFHRYFQHNTVPVHLWFSAYDASVEEILTALELRQRHIDFALEHGRKPDEELAKEFKREFGS